MNDNSISNFFSACEIQDTPFFHLTDSLFDCHVNQTLNKEINTEDNSRIPFVKIHTTDVRPQQLNFEHSFRRNNNNNNNSDVIKSEPIKSEGNDQSKEITTANTSPVLPIRSSNNQFLENSEVLDARNNEEPNDSGLNNSPNDVAELENDLLKVAKCSLCPFIALEENILEDHLTKTHQANLQSLQSQKKTQKCPGCENIFWSWKSLEAHLTFDHLVGNEDLTKFKSFCEKNGFLEKAPPLVPAAQQKIYLKNVDCLIEPRVADYHLIGESSSPSISTNNSIVSTQPKKQKISIKSVDVLREQVFIHPETNINNNNNNSIASNEGFLSCLSSEAITNSNSSNNEPSTTDNLLEINSLISDLDEAYNNRRPKIYLKNMDNLKEPNFSTNTLGDHGNGSVLHIQGSGNFAIVPDNLNMENAFPNDDLALGSGFIEPNFTDNNQEQQFPIFENTSNNFFLQPGDVETENIVTFDFNNIILDSSTFGTNFNNDLDSNHQNQMFTTNPLVLSENGNPLLSLPSSPKSNFALQQPETPAKAPIQKIFIKNVAILKDPQYQEQQKGTLHLRTVDQLNLMNRNEVEGLITPNIQHNFGGKKFQYSETSNKTSENENKTSSNDDWRVENYSFDDLDGLVVENISNFESIPSNEISQELNLSTSSSLDFVSDSHQDSSNIIILSSSEIPNENRNFSNDLVNENPNTKILTNNSSNSNPPKVSIRSVEILKPNNTSGRILTSFEEVPPLTSLTKTNLSPANSNSSSVLNNISNIPVPPLVPMRPFPQADKIPLQKSPTKSISLVNAANDKQASSDKGRIYVANNLLETNVNENSETSLLYPNDNEISASEKPSSKTKASSGGVSVRGRPFGARNLGANRKNKLSGAVFNSENVNKCTVSGCNFRFNKPETLEYHIKCHNGSFSSTICPQCKLTEFNNWNTLHTHLWRSHKIDMELYTCDKCPFKTPVYSRLVNTHLKTHSNERNFKCNECSKLFKNSKQLKNHRRWHRNNQKNKDLNEVSPKLYNCDYCPKAFSNNKSLKEHKCNIELSLKCSECDKVLSSKSSLKLHMRLHQQDKRFECGQCSYLTSDHNAFRRHCLTHGNERRYECPYCSYKSIQSISFQKHLKQKHPDFVDSVLFQCERCTFSTVNRSLYHSHEASHFNVSSHESEEMNH